MAGRNKCLSSQQMILRIIFLSELSDACEDFFVVRLQVLLSSGADSGESVECPVLYSTRAIFDISEHKWHDSRQVRLDVIASEIFAEFMKRIEGLAKHNLTRVLQLLKYAQQGWEYRSVLLQELRHDVL